MTAEIIDFEKKYIEKLENELEAEAEIIFEGEGVMDGVDFLSAMKSAGLHVMVIMEDDEGDEQDE